jgi:hypothetical protein
VRNGRDYSPTLGRWLEHDPLGFFGGDFNLYRYVQNQPTSTVDPSGLAPMNPQLQTPGARPTVPFGPPGVKEFPFTNDPISIQIGTERLEWDPKRGRLSGVDNIPRRGDPNWTFGNPMKVGCKQLANWMQATAKSIAHRMIEAQWWVLKLEQMMWDAANGALQGLPVPTVKEINQQIKEMKNHAARIEQEMNLLKDLQAEFAARRCSDPGGANVPDPLTVVEAILGAALARAAAECAPAPRVAPAMPGAPKGGVPGGTRRNPLSEIEEWIAAHKRAIATYVQILTLLTLAGFSGPWIWPFLMRAWTLLPRVAPAVVKPR